MRKRGAKTNTNSHAFTQMHEHCHCKRMIQHITHTSKDGVKEDKKKQTAQHIFMVMHFTVSCAHKMLRTKKTQSIYLRLQSFQQNHIETELEVFKSDRVHIETVKQKSTLTQSD